MEQNASQIVQLFDGQQRPVGQINLEREEGNLFFGKFIPGPAFASVEKLFRDFEEAVNVQALSVVDELDAAIGALGLYLRSPNGARSEIHDVQIWSDGGITYRVRESSLGTWNGSPGVVQAAQPTPK